MQVKHTNIDSKTRLRQCVTISLLMILSACYEVTDLEDFVDEGVSTLQNFNDAETQVDILDSDQESMREDATIELDISLSNQDQTVIEQDIGSMIELDAEVIELDAEVIELDAEVIELDAEMIELDAEVIELDAEVIELDLGINDMDSTLPNASDMEITSMMDAAIDMMSMLADCTGVIGGMATLDACNICSGGSTGHVANSDQDQCGVCFGEGPSTWYHDGDGDGLGDPNIHVNVCERPEGFVANALDERPDCANPQIDLCGVCSGGDTGHIANSDMDECGVCFGEGILTWFADEDGDGLGDPNDSQRSCEIVVGYVVNANDTEPLCSTNNTDQCGICAGDGLTCLDCALVPFGEATIDDCDVCSGGNTSHLANSDKDVCGICFGLGAQTWFEDLDEDGLGDPQVAVNACIQPVSFVGNQDDTEPTCASNDEDVCGVCGGDGQSCHCENSCPYDDGVCDDGGLNARFGVCLYGTDCRDCGIRPRGQTDNILCTRTCATSDNGVCEDGGASSSLSTCDYGTDCQDCDARFFDSEIDILCLNTCSTHHNGFCSDGGEGSRTNGCSFGTDCADCGPRDYLVSAPALCNNDCRWSRDGACDDRGPDSAYSLCSFGSDCADCGARVFNPNDIPACTNSCEDERDGWCDDGGIGSATSICDLGTDCADCGSRIDMSPPQEPEETLTCSTNDDCLPQERCDQGVCLINRCSALTYDSISPLGDTYIFYSDLEIGILDEDRGGEAFYDVSCYGAESVLIGDERRMILEEVWRPSADPMTDIAGGRFLDQDREFFAVASPDVSQVRILSSPEQILNVPFVPTGLGAGDINADGIDEVLVMSDHAFAVCSLDGQCSTWTFPDTVTLRDISAGDIDGDLWTELVLVITQNGVSSLYIQNFDAAETGQAEFYQGQIRYGSQRISVGDFNGDERDEIAVLEVIVGVFGQERVAVHELSPSLETGEMIISRIFSEGTGHTRILDLAVGDLNADGAANLVLVDEADFIVFYDVDLNNPNAHLNRQYDARMVLSEDPKRIALADFDGDSPKATLSAPPSTVPGAEIPIAVLTLPPHDQTFSGGHSSSGYGAREVNSE
jgi:hypothetical protein